MSLLAFRGTIIGLIGGSVIGVVIVVSLVLVAVGDPGGWAPWRIVLVTLWVIPVCAMFGASFGMLEDSHRD